MALLTFAPQDHTFSVARKILRLHSGQSVGGPITNMALLTFAPQDHTFSVARKILDYTQASQWEGPSQIWHYWPLPPKDHTFSVARKILDYTQASQWEGPSQIWHYWPLPPKDHTFSVARKILDYTQASQWEGPVFTNMALLTFAPQRSYLLMIPNMKALHKRLSIHHTQYTFKKRPPYEVLFTGIYWNKLFFNKRIRSHPHNIWKGMQVKRIIARFISLPFSWP